MKKPPYIERLKINISGNPNFIFKSKDGCLIANGYDRIEIGGRGPYIEFSDDQLFHDNITIPTDQLWRLDSKYQDRIYYIEYRSKCSGNIKIYKQLRPVNYANYIISKWYISPFDLFTNEMEVVII